jgi:hypothetical protein
LTKLFHDSKNVLSVPRQRKWDSLRPQVKLHI